MTATVHMLDRTKPAIAVCRRGAHTGHRGPFGAAGAMIHGIGQKTICAVMGDY